MENLAELQSLLDESGDRDNPSAEEMKALMELFCSICQERTIWIRVRHGAWHKWVCKSCGSDHDDNYKVAVRKDASRP